MNVMRSILVVALVGQPLLALGEPPGELLCNGELKPLAEAMAGKVVCSEPVWVRLPKSQPLAVSVQDIPKVEDLGLCTVMVRDAVSLRAVSRGELVFPEAPKALARIPMEEKWQFRCRPPVRVVVEAPGYASGTAVFGKPGERVVLLEPQKELTLELVPLAEGQVCWVRERDLRVDVLFRSASHCTPLAAPTRLTLPGGGATLLVLAKGLQPALISMAEVPEKQRVSLESGVSLPVVVVDQNHQPKPGAKVEVTQKFSLADGFPFTQEATTDAQGRTTVTGLVAGKATVRATAGGFTARREVQLPVEEPLVLELQRAVTLVGQVVDRRGRPVVGAQVSEEKGSATTDAQGRFQLHLGPEDSVRLTVKAQGFVPWEGELAQPTGEPLRIVLEPAATVVWPFLLPSPAEGRARAFVVVDEETSRRREVPGTWNPLAGEASFQDLPPGKAVLEVTVEGFLPMEQEVLVEPGQGELRLPVTALKEGYALSGTVVAGDDGTPVAGAKVTAFPGDEDTFTSLRATGRRPSTFTNSRGEFLLAGLSEEPHTVVVEAPGFAPLYLSGKKPERPANELGHLELQRGFTLAARVVNTDGSPVSGARVEVRRGKAYEYQPLASARSDSNGGVTLHHLPPGSLTVRFGLPGRFRETNVEGGNGELVEKDLLMAGVHLRGQVLRAGQLVTKGELSFTRGEVVRHGPVVMISRDEGDVQLFGVTGVKGFRVPITPLGTFEASDVDPGNWRVYLNDEEGGSAPVSVFVPNMSEASLTLNFPAGTLHGVVVNDRGEPLGGVVVRALRQGESFTTTSNPQGQFVLRGLPPGEVELQGDKDGYRQVAPVRVRVEEEVAQARLVMENTQTKVLVTLEADRGWIGGAPAVLCGPSQALAYADADGRVAFSATPGGYQVCALAFGGSLGCSAPFQVTQGEAKELSLPLSGAGWLRLPEGMEPSSTSVTSEQGCDLSSLIALANLWRRQKERWLLGPLVPGRYMVRVPGHGPEVVATEP